MTQDSIKVLLIIGSVLAGVGAVITIIEIAGQQHVDARDFIGPIVVIVVTVLIFIMVGLIHVRKAQIPLNAWLLIIFVVLEIVLSGEALLSLVGIGIIVEIVATTMLAMLEN
ncbi:MAG: hypothetical protein JW839_04390 [Candidatus Lokiarchaeota archaeon]|nr:hypothetical protein [Candidatus Lokiarchaeota archaeon]